MAGMRSQSLAVKYAPQAPESLDTPPARTAIYGGLVGEMIREAEERMAQPAEANVLAPALSSRVDPIHVFSIMAGYIGLAGGFGVAGLLCLRLAQVLTS
jgi:hypothetical protein